MKNIFTGIFALCLLLILSGCNQTDSNAATASKWGEVGKSLQVTYRFAAAENQTVSIAVFTNVASDAPYAQAVAWAVEKGITNCTSATTFSPNDTCTRGQIVTFLWRYMESK